MRDPIYASPESVGIRSEDILKFIKYVEDNKINLHSFLFMKDGVTVAEGYCPPFDENFLHRLYSASKTYVAVAVGMLVSEGRVSLSDRVLDFFPEYNTERVPELMRECTVEDALMMSTPHVAGARINAEQTDNPYEQPCQQPSGTVFNYNDGNMMCTAIVERVTGMRFLDYMRPLFDKLGIDEDIKCLIDLGGISWGGSGILSTMRDFATFAEFVRNKGEYMGEQLVDREYMERMTSLRTTTVASNFYSQLSTYGYGYQTWITPDAACLRGMGCQEAFCFNEKGLLFVCLGDSQVDPQDFSDTRVYEAVKYLVYDEIGEPMPEGEAYYELKEKLANLHLPLYGAPHAKYERELSDAYYALGENAMGWSDVRLHISGEEGSLTYRNARGVKTVRFGMGKYLKGKFPETHYYDEQRGVPSGRELDCLAIAEWIEDRKLLLRVYITDVSFANLFCVIAFKGDRIVLQLKKRGEFLLEDYGGIATGNIVK